MNDNFTAIKTAVDDNDARITNNASSITDNATIISDNNTGINSNTASISNNTTAITTIQTQLPIVVIDGNNSNIGALINLSDDILMFDVFTQQGYMVLGIAFSTGEVFPTSLWYANTTCSGIAYTPNGVNGAVISAYDEGVNKSV